uniref:Sulfatase domain-containing protein n=1 Tax=Parastrongyloides trichosuri TaxID=131310 RepID=A0A0N5A1R9_PARTI
MFVEDSIKTITTTDLQYFNDVDRKTGEYIDYAIKEKYLKWDFLFIYFLGLDQGGHFLNSDNDELMKMKLDELDDYVVKIYNDMSMKDENFIIIVTGDHGMTRHGSHGGSDRTETESAFLISFNNKMFNEKFDNNFINQIDITPTILNLFGIDRTSDSIGITYDFTFNFFERSYMMNL